MLISPPVELRTKEQEKRMKPITISPAARLFGLCAALFASLAIVAPVQAQSLSNPTLNQPQAPALQAQPQSVFGHDRPELVADIQHPGYTPDGDIRLLCRVRNVGQRDSLWFKVRVSWGYSYWTLLRGWRQSYSEHTEFVALTPPGPQHLTSAGIWKLDEWQYEVHVPRPAYLVRSPYAIVEADIDNVVAELNKSNNTAHAP
jgi:hypothetical protein